MMDRNQHGFTLVELLIAMLLAGVLLGGMMRLVQATTTGFQWQQGLSQTLQDSRFALDHLSDAIRGAGFHPEPWSGHVLSPLGSGATNGRLVLQQMSRHSCYGTSNPVTGTDGLPAWGLKVSTWHRTPEHTIKWTCAYGAPGGPLTTQVNQLGLVQGATEFTVRLGSLETGVLQWHLPDPASPINNVVAVRISLTVETTSKPANDAGTPTAMTLTSTTAIRGRRP